MSFDPVIRESELCHALAEQFKPDVPVADTTIWVAIILHTKDLDKIERADDFLWVKCHRRITARTLKYMYFSRYPLAEFRLEHQHQVLAETEQLKDIYERDHIQDGTLILRVIDLDQDHAELITYRRQSPSPVQQRHSADGKHFGDAFAIESDESDGEGADAVAAMITAASEMANTNALQSNNKRAHAAVELNGNDIVEENTSNTKRVKLDGPAESSHQANAVNDVPANAKLALSPTLDTGVVSNISQTSQGAPTSFNTDTFPDYEKIAQTASSITVSNWFSCICGKYAHWRGWTQLDEAINPLCTGCSHAKLLNERDVDGLQSLERLTQEARNEKARLLSLGVPQNLEDNDVPENPMQPLEETLMQSHGQLQPAESPESPVQVGNDTQPEEMVGSQVATGVSLPDYQPSTELDDVAPMPAETMNGPLLPNGTNSTYSYYQYSDDFPGGNPMLSGDVLEAARILSNATEDGQQPGYLPADVLNAVSAQACADENSGETVEEREEEEEMDRWFNEHNDARLQNENENDNVVYSESMQDQQHAQNPHTNSSPTMYGHEEDADRSDEKEKECSDADLEDGGDGIGDADNSGAKEDKDDPDFIPDDDQEQSSDSDEDDQEYAPSDT